MRFGKLVWTNWVLVASIALGGAGVGPALAQVKEAGWPPPEGAACKPSKKDVDEAKTLFGLGKNAHDTSNYTDAIRYYRDAYKRDCTAHLLLKNLGKVYEADAQYAAAVDAYKLYRARGKPTGEELDLLDAKINNLTRKIAAATPAPSPSPPSPSGSSVTMAGPPPAPSASGEPKGVPSPDASARGATSAKAPPSSSPATAASVGNGGGGPGALPWVLVGVGGAMAIGGGVLWVTSNKKVSDTLDQFNAKNCGQRQPLTGALFNECKTLESDGNSAKSSRTAGIVVSLVGVAALGVGVGWVLVAGSKGRDTAALRIGPGPTFASLGVSGAF